MNARDRGRDTRSTPSKATRGAAGERRNPRGKSASEGATRTGAESSDRLARVAERIRGELADMLLRGEVRDPATNGALVSAVTVTGDLSLARVFLRVLDTTASEARKRDVVAAFDRARGHIRRELAARLSRGSGAMRSVPELRFAWDDTTDRAARLDEVFAEVAADRAREDRAREDAPTTGADDEP